jgi:anthranilate phosphoribosyltransferase
VNDDAGSGFQAPREEHPFARYIRILGKGKTGTRSLNFDEARDAFSMLLRGEVEDLQRGAFLMLLRVKEETGEELAGFIRACRDHMLAPPQGLKADLDWSSYAGKKHQHPWFLLSLLLLNQAGYRVLVHWSDGHTPGRLYTEQAMSQLGLPIASDWTDVERQLEEQKLSYLPLRQFCRPLHDMMQLRPLLGLRSPVNTLSRMLNPLRAGASIQSVFHPAYAELHQDADILLGQGAAGVFRGDSGEVEVRPQADTRLSLLVGGQRRGLLIPRECKGRVDSVATPGVEALKRLWQGRGEDAYGEAAALATTAAALLILEGGTDVDGARREAGRLWRHRNRQRLG